MTALVICGGLYAAVSVLFLLDLRNVIDRDTP
jgi:hypothetical protein